MAKKRLSKARRNKKIVEKSAEKFEENLQRCENSNKLDIKNIDSKSNEWKPITDFHPRKKSIYIKTRDRVSGAYSNLTKWTKEALEETKQKISSENIARFQEKALESVKKASDIVKHTKSANEIEELGEAGHKLFAGKIAAKYAAALIATVMLIALTFYFGIRPVVVVSLDKTAIAVVPDKKSFEEILLKLQNSWKNTYKKDIKIKGVLSYKMRLLPSRVISSPRQVAEAIETHTDSLVKADAITVNGEAKVIIKDTDTAQKVLNSIKEKFAPKQEGSVQFSENVKIADIFVLPEIIQSEQNAVGALLASVDTVKEYTVKQGDTLWDIAENNNVPIEKLAELNPDIGDSLKPGQIIRLTVPKNIINVKTIEYTEVKEDTPYETKFESDPNRVKGERKVLTFGVAGKKLYKVQIVKQNGVEVSRTILDEQVIEEPKTEVIAIGTKANAIKAATGAFRVPAFGSITSRFGYRWGRIHEGIDISGRIGQPIYAADGGKVIFSGVESGYGNLVKIDHGNGLVTFYGHCSRLLVSVGQKVSKGDKIALVGSTGNSTGPHVHFEVRKNGVPVDPMGYLK